MSALRYAFFDGSHHLVLEIGRIADVTPCNEVFFFLERAIEEKRPKFDGVDLDKCLVRRISHVARPGEPHCDTGPAFQIENAITGEVYVAEYYHHGVIYDPDDPNEFDFPEHLKKKPAGGAGPETAL